MVDVQLSDAEKTFIIHGVQDNLREDGRGCDDYRYIELETDVVSNTSGSAKLRLANTDILVGVKAELGEPLPEKPDRGRIEFFVDCSANATPEFEGRGGEELATEISNMLTRAYDCPSCIDLTKLCVVPGQQCWILYVDVLLLECGGNLFDASSLAVKAAIFNASIPTLTVSLDEGHVELELSDDPYDVQKVDVTIIPTLTVSQDEGHVELELSDDPYDVQKVDVTKAPCIVTLNKIGHSHVVDASQKEEGCCLARLMLGVTENGTVTAMKKEGSGSLEVSSVEDMLETGKRVGQSLNKSLMEILITDSKPVKKKTVTGYLR